MRALVLLSLLSIGCGSDHVATTDPDASLGFDASIGAESGMDASIGGDGGPQDAATDASTEAGTDAATAPDSGPSVDAGPVCECSSGPCCDGCHFRPATFQCSTRASGPDTQAQCAIFQGSVCGGSGYTRIVYSRWDRWCSGSSPSCDGAITSGEATTTVTCDADGTSPWASRCVADTALGAHCEVCP